jgi:hypothetical protein
MAYLYFDNVVFGRDINLNLFYLFHRLLKNMAFLNKIARVLFALSWIKL